MAYKCPQCGYLSNEPGNCPTCGIPMQPVGSSEANEPSEEDGVMSPPDIAT